MLPTSSSSPYKGVKVPGVTIKKVSKDNFVKIVVRPNETSPPTRTRGSVDHVTETFETMCKRAVNTYYSIATLQASDLQYVALLKNKVVGIMIARVVKKPIPVMYVYIVCSMKKGVGTMLMRVIEAKARELGAPYVALDSTRDAYGFYRRIGYAPSGATKEGMHMRKVLV
jgi:hypothetical protein